MSKKKESPAQAQSCQKTCYDLPSNTSPEMDLTTAIRILQTIATTRKNSLVEPSGFDSVGHYGSSQVRHAFYLVARDIITQEQGWRNEPIFAKTEKQTDCGAFEIHIHKFGHPDQEQDIANVLRLTLLRNSNPQIELKMALTDDHMYRGSVAFGFNDFRHGRKIFVSEADLAYGKSTNRNTYNFWQGYRWGATNLLRWKEGFILPEHLDHGMIQ
jgi:hypothetical protein